MSGIVFIQPGFAHYRNELFEQLSRRHNIKFVYWNRGNVYPGSIRPGGFNYEFVEPVLRSRIIGLIHGFIRSKPDVIVSSVSSSPQSVVSFIYSKLTGRKFVLWIEEWQAPRITSFGPTGIFRRLRAATGRMIIRRCNVLIASGTASCQYALAIGKREKEIVTTIQCSDDLAKVDATAGERGNHHKTILYLGRIIDWKGLDILLRAFSMIEKERDDVALVVAGDGPFRSYCQELAGKLNVRKVEFLGKVEPEGTARIYEMADIFVLPSCNRNGKYETWGLVINEAMSMGLPILTTTAVGAGYDMLREGENGTVVAEGDSAALYSGLKTLLDADLPRMSRCSRTIFEEKNDVKKMADSFSRAITFPHAG